MDADEDASQDAEEETSITSKSLSFSIAKGSAKIYIAYDGAIIDSCKVTVKSSTSATVTYAKKITLKKKATLKVGKQKNLSVTTAPAKATIKNAITWTSSNEKVATVDKNGTATAVSAGTCTIKAKSSGLATAKCKVKVKSAN